MLQLLIVLAVAWAYPYMIREWMRHKTEAAVFRRVDGRLVDYPDGCCTATCGAGLQRAELDNVPINIGIRKSLNDHIAIRMGDLVAEVDDSAYQQPDALAEGETTVDTTAGTTDEDTDSAQSISAKSDRQLDGDDLIGLPANPGGYRISTESEMRNSMVCVEKYKEETNCICRLDVDITAGYHYLCEQAQEEWWRYLGNSHLTGGPYEHLLVDEVVLGLIMPWAKMEEMLWIYLFSNDDDHPCTKPYSSRKLSFVETSFRMNQFNFHLKPNNTITIPSAWTFVPQEGWLNKNWYLFKDVTTRAHMSRGTYTIHP